MKDKRYKTSDVEYGSTAQLGHAAECREIIGASVVTLPSGKMMICVDVAPPCDSLAKPRQIRLYLGLDIIDEIKDQFEGVTLN